MNDASLWAIFGVWCLAVTLAANVSIGSAPPKCVYAADTGEYLGMWGPDADSGEHAYLIGPCRVRGNGIVIMGAPSIELR